MSECRKCDREHPNDGCADVGCNHNCEAATPAPEPVTGLATQEREALALFTIAQGDVEAYGRTDALVAVVRRIVAARVADAEARVRAERMDYAAVKGYELGYEEGRAEVEGKVRALADAWSDPDWYGRDTAAPFARALRAALSSPEADAPVPQQDGDDAPADERPVPPWPRDDWPTGGELHVYVLTHPHNPHVTAALDQLLKDAARGQRCFEANHDRPRAGSMNARTLPTDAGRRLADGTLPAHPYPPPCHPDCVLGPDTDHNGTDAYRCVDADGHAIPFPGEGTPE